MNEAQKYLLQDLSVAIVDDHALILEGFKSLMQGCNAKNVETFGCAADLIDAMGRHSFDIYIIDIGLPDIDGFELIDKIRSRHAGARIIVNMLFISENTVEAHRKRLFVKLGARNIADLIVKAIDRGYINASEIVKGNKNDKNT